VNGDEILLTLLLLKTTSGEKCDAKLSDDSDPLGDGGNEFPVELKFPVLDCGGE
jgi:hypothetical protein